MSSVGYGSPEGDGFVVLKGFGMIPLLGAFRDLSFTLRATYLEA